jgi:hypothetical protein
MVAGAARFFGIDPLETARLANFLIFALTFLLVDRILFAAGVSRLHRLGADFLFAWAPMNLFYYASPMVDPLAVGLSLLSLFACLRLAGAEGSRRVLWFSLLLTSGMLSAAIKSPVYLPVFLAVLAHAAAGRFRRLRPAEILAYVAAIGATVYGFKIWSNAVNGIGSFFASHETVDYFGPAADRLDSGSWLRIGRVLFQDVADPMVTLLAIAGIGLWIARSGHRDRALFAGLAGGWAVTVLVFFNRFTWHNYYFLGGAFPVAFFAAYALDRATEGRARALSIGALLLAGYTVFASSRALERLSSTPTEWIRAEGEFIRDATREDDFVVYLMQSEDFEDWNPVFLYFAKRHGYNVTTRRFARRPEILASIAARHHRGAGRFLFFCPSGVTARFEPILEAQGARLMEAGPPGRLYLVFQGSQLTQSP